MRTIIITDCETTGLDPATCKTIEVAACLYDVEHATPIEWCSWLMYAESNEAEAINKIPAALLATLPDGTRAWNRVAEMVELAEQRGPACYVAHRAEIERLRTAVRDVHRATRERDDDCMVCGESPAHHPLCPIGRVVDDDCEGAHVGAAKGGERG